MEAVGETGEAASPYLKQWGRWKLDGQAKPQIMEQSPHGGLDQDVSAEASV